MKTRFLFPYWCKYLGIVCFCAHIPFVLFNKALGFSKDSAISDSLFSSQHIFYVTTTLLMLTGLVLFAFSKEKIEDEQIAQLRLNSLQWTMYLSYILLILALAFTTNRQDAKNLVHLNVWVPLVLFIILFRCKMFRNSRLTNEDAI